MTAADYAYKEAQRLIAKAKRAGNEELNFDTLETRALTHIPLEIADLPNLRTIKLSNTQVFDLSALASLTSLDILYLGRTQIRDLRPIAGLHNLSKLSLRETDIYDLKPISILIKLQALDLSRTDVADLKPLSQLENLSQLWLDHSPIDDISPISNLKNLVTLSISGTAVYDLRPLRRIYGLSEKDQFGGLTFVETLATQLDPRIAEIAEIENNATRARELFAYLENWVPPGETLAPPPKPDPIFETILIDGKLELAADLPSMAEQAEPLKKALHQRLQSSVPDLARAAGNIFPKLAAKARVLAGLVDRPFAELDLLAIHFEIELLQDRQNRGTEDDIPFSNDVLGPLSDVTRTGPGLTLGHEAVDLYLARVREARETPQPEAEEAAHRALSEAMVNDPDANGPNSIAMENRIAALEDQAQRQAGWMAKHKWLVWALPVTGSLITGVTVELIGQNFGPAITAFVTNNAALLSEIAATYGGTFFNWFAGIMGPVFLALGVKDAIKKTKR